MSNAVRPVTRTSEPADGASARMLFTGTDRDRFATLYDIEQMDYQEMKRCPRCGLAKPLTEFHRTRLRHDGHQPYCKPCKRGIDRLRYVRRRGAGIRRKNDFDRRRVEWLRSLKAGRPCHDCRRSFPPEAMQWDHLPGVPKLGDVSTLRGRSKQEVLDEIAKCELVCTNCHTIRTFRRAGWTLDEPRAQYLYVASVG